MTIEAIERALLEQVQRNTITNGMSEPLKVHECFIYGLHLALSTTCLHFLILTFFYAFRLV